jgi:hypothetical protein
MVYRASRKSRIINELKEARQNVKTILHKQTQTKQEPKKESRKVNRTPEPLVTSRVESLKRALDLKSDIKKIQTLVKSGDRKKVERAVVAANKLLEMLEKYKTIFVAPKKQVEEVKALRDVAKYKLRQSKMERGFVMPKPKSRNVGNEIAPIPSTQISWADRERQRRNQRNLGRVH